MLMETNGNQYAIYFSYFVKESIPRYLTLSYLVLTHFQQEALLSCAEVVTYISCAFGIRTDLCKAKRQASTLSHTWQPSEDIISSQRFTQDSARSLVWGDLTFDTVFSHKEAVTAEWCHKGFRTVLCGHRQAHPSVETTLSKHV